MHLKQSDVVVDWRRPHFSLGCPRTLRASWVDPPATALRNLRPHRADRRLSQNEIRVIRGQNRLDLPTSFGNNAPV